MSKYFYKDAEFVSDVDLNENWNCTMTKKNGGLQEDLPVRVIQKLLKINKILQLSTFTCGVFALLIRKEKKKVHPNEKAFKGNDQ